MLTSQMAALGALAAALLSGCAKGSDGSDDFTNAATDPTTSETGTTDTAGTMDTAETADTADTTSGEETAETVDTNATTDTTDTDPPPTPDFGADTGVFTPITADCEAATETEGAVWFQPEAGLLIDLTSVFTAGSWDTPVRYTVSDPGTLAFCPGTWHVALTLEADVLLQGEDAATTTLSGAQQALVIDVTPGLRVSLIDLTVADGSPDADRDYLGGAIHAESAILSIRRSIFPDNTSSQGGAIYLDGGLLDISGAVFRDNSASLTGGAIYARGEAQVVIDDSSFTGNAALHYDGYGGGLGGALYIEGELWLTSSDFHDNYADLWGAGLTLVYGEGTVYDSTFTDNVPDGLYIAEASASASGLTVSGNGRGILLRVDAALTLLDSEVTDNLAQGIYAYDRCSLEMSGVTVSRNGDGGLSGGGLYSSGQALTITDSLFEDNYGEYGGAAPSRDGVAPRWRGSPSPTTSRNIGAAAGSTSRARERWRSSTVTSATTRRSTPTSETRAPPPPGARGDRHL